MKSFKIVSPYCIMLIMFCIYFGPQNGNFFYFTKILLLYKVAKCNESTVIVRPMDPVFLSAWHLQL